MAETKHTDRAVRAVKIFDWFNNRFGVEIGFFTNEDAEQLNAIIDQETGLPTLQSSIEELEAEANSWGIVALSMGKEIVELKAEKAELVDIIKRFVYWSPDGDETQANIIEDARNALIKPIPVSEQGEETTNPKNER